MLRAATTAIPDDQQAWIKLAQALRLHGASGATEALARAQQLAATASAATRARLELSVEQRLTTWLLQARVYLNEGRPVEALEALELAARQSANDPRAAALRREIEEAPR